MGWIFPWSCAANVPALWCMESAMGLGMLVIWELIARSL